MGLRGLQGFLSCMHKKKFIFFPQFSYKPTFNYADIPSATLLHTSSKYASSVLMEEWKLPTKYAGFFHSQQEVFLTMFWVLVISLATLMVILY